MQNDTIACLKSLPVEIIEVAFDKSTKAKSVNAVLKYVNEETFSHVIVLDADNIMSENYLCLVDAYLGTEVQVLQTQRQAKNTHTPIALLDAINEAVGNHIFRKGHITMGLSAALIGSGMVCRNRVI